MKKNYVLVKVVICLLLVLTTCKVYSQQFDDRSFYLIDSMDIKQLPVKEKEGLEGELKKFHNVESDSVKINKLLNCVSKVSSMEIRIRYVDWALSFINSIINREFTSEKQRFYFQSKKIGFTIF